MQNTGDLVIFETFYYTSTLYEVQNSIGGVVLTVISIILLTALFNVGRFCLYPKLTRIRKILDYDEQYNDSFFCWFYSLWPLFKKIYCFCLQANLLSGILVRFISHGFIFHNTKNPSYASTNSPTDRFVFVFEELSFFPYLVCVLFFMMRQFGLSFGRTIKRILGILCFLIYLGLIVLLLFVNYDIYHANPSILSAPEFPLLWSKERWFRILYGCWKLTFIFDLDSWIKWNILSLSMLPISLLFYLLQKSAFDKVLPSSTTVFLDSLSALGFRNSLIIAVSVYLGYFSFSLLCKISEIFDEIAECQTKGILPKKYKNSKKQARELETQDAASSDMDAIYLTKIRRATVKNSQRLRYFLLIAFGISFFFSVDLLCVMQGNHLLFGLIMQCVVGLKIFWTSKRVLIVNKIKKTSNSLTESEVAKAFFEVCSKFHEYVIYYTIGCLGCSFISMFVAPLSTNITEQSMQAQSTIFWCVFGFSTLILVVGPLIALLVYLKSFESGFAVPELAVVLIAANIVGCGILPMSVMVIELWISWNVYSRFIYTYSEKKLQDEYL